MATATHNLDIEIVARSTATITFDIYEDDGTTEWGVAATDQVRFKVWSTDDAAPDLDISKTESANGSVIKITTDGVSGTTAAVATLVLAQDDTATLVGGKRYKCELGYVDDSATSPADAYSIIADGYIRVKGSATGDRRLES